MCNPFGCLFRRTERPRATHTVPVSNPLSITSSTPHPVGYEVLSEGENPTVADVIFVHGLRGHRRDTWAKQGVCWPKDLLGKEPTLSNVRILSFGYDSRVVVFGGRVSLNSIFKHSISFMNGLSREREDTNRPIIFIAHSLGGLIVKDAIHHLDNHRTNRPDFATILDATRGIVFLGTPHRGSSATTLPKLIASVVQVFQDVNLGLIQDVEMESQILDRIGDSFGQILDRQRLMVFSFEEELPMPWGRKVVEGGSAIIGYPSERRDTIYANHVNMVKFSDRSEDGYKKILHAIKVLLEEKQKSTRRAGVPSQAARYYDVPPFHVPYYVERKKPSTRLDELLSNRSASLPRIVVLLGMGGTGKTQLALEYCRRMKHNRIFRGIFWLDASSRNALESSMMAISKQLWPDRIVNNAREGVKLVRTTLSDWSDRWLLVFDNYDNPSEFPNINHFFPDSIYGSILITSRSGFSKELGDVIELDQMEKDEGQQLLLHSSQADAEDVAVIEKILARLAYLPLAIDQVRAYISKQRLSLTDFEREYERRKRNFMKETPLIWQYSRALPGMAEESSINLLTTWELSLELLNVGMEHGGKLGSVLTLFAFLHPVSIREGLFRHDVGDGRFGRSPMGIFEENGEWSHDKFEEAVIRMQEHSLIQFSRQQDEIVISLHSMVSEWLRLRLDKSVLSTTLDMAASHLEIYVESAEFDFMKAQEALLHMDSIRQIATAERTDIVEFYSSFGKFYGMHGRLEDAEKMYDGALAAYEKTLGREHASTLDMVKNLGNLYVSQGRLEEAEKMYGRALGGFERTLGPGHASSLDAVYELGVLYTTQRRLEEAGKMYSRVLAGREMVFGPDHTKTLDTVNSIGNLYRIQGHLEDAEKMYARALAGFENTLGVQPTSILKILVNLGILYSEQRRLEDAEKVYERALAGFEKAFGTENSKTLHVVSNLSLLYSAQGRFEDAEKMHIRALAGFEKALGAEHTLTLATVNNLSVLYRKQGRFEDAKKMCDRALAGYEKVFGAEHTLTLGAVSNLGVVYSQQGRFEDAEKMCDRALAGKEKVLGAEHSSTLGTVNNLGVVYRQQGRFEDAEKLHDRALAGFEKTLGGEHAYTLETVHNLGVLYSDQGLLESAEKMFERALAGREKVLGAEHTETLETVNDLGVLYRKQGRFEDAETMHDRALAGYERALGARHASTLSTVNNLGVLYFDQGRLEDAERIFDHALAGREKALGLEHPATLDTVNNLGKLYASQGRLKDAEKMYERALAGREKALGAKYPSTLDTIKSLGLLYSDQGRPEDAKRMYDRAG